MVSLKLAGLSKAFPGQVAVDNLSMTVPSGELFCLLGPSGCGKSTTLQMIAGLITPDSGQILIDGKDITRTPVQRRNIGVVFQNFALFPNMTIAQNVAYGLKARRQSREAVAKKTSEMLEFVGLAQKRDRYPAHLSGGEQQRVALARALAIDPALLLLDEPFSSLDRELRLELRNELARIQRETKLTMVFVTHDQEEAFAIAHSIGICNAGRLQQVSAPRRLYDTPANAFVARFVGRSNLLTGSLGTLDGSPVVTVDGVPLAVSRTAAGRADEATVLIRPEHVRLSATRPPHGLAVQGVVSTAEYSGSAILYHVAALGQTILASQPTSRQDVAARPGDTTYLWWEAEDCYVLGERSAGSEPQEPAGSEVRRPDPVDAQDRRP